MKNFSILISILMMVGLTACDVDLTQGSLDWTQGLFDKTPTLLPTTVSSGETPVSMTAAPEAALTQTPGSENSNGCGGLNLTPEECINNGNHNYSVKGVVSGGCEYGIVENQVAHGSTEIQIESIPVPIYFKKIDQFDLMVGIPEDSNSHSWFYTEYYKKSGQNTYSATINQDTQSDTKTVIFTSTGFTITTVETFFPSNNICTWIENFVLLN